MNTYVFICVTMYIHRHTQYYEDVIIYYQITYYPFYILVILKIDGLENGNAKFYQVSCSGSCGEVSLDLSAAGGDADLYAG